MKKILTWVVLYLFLGSTVAFAQEAFIIELAGDVQVKVDADSEWGKAAEGQALKGQSQVKTGNDGRAIIAFGEGRSNIINVDKNTSIVIEEVKPGAVFLPSGRVFSIIRELSQIENFQIKTPTAVAGARGTGWVTEYYKEGETRITVFEDNVYVAGLDENGFEVTRFDISEDFAASVMTGGKRSDVEPISPQERDEWNREMKVMLGHIEAHERGQRHGPPDGAMMPQHPWPGPGPGPMPPQDMNDQQLLEYMRASGDFTEQQLLEMQQKMESGFETLSEDEMRLVMEYMAEMENLNLSPEEQAMKEEILQNQDVIQQMSPEERDVYFQGLEDKYGVVSPTQDSGGEHFDQYMDRYNAGGDQQFVQGGGESYHDPYFGSFDQQWSGDGGFYVNNEFHYYEDEFYETIHNQPPPGCLCPVDCSLTFEQCPPHLPPP